MPNDPKWPCVVPVRVDEHGDVRVKGARFDVGLGDDSVTFEYLDIRPTDEGRVAELEAKLTRATDLLGAATRALSDKDLSLSTRKLVVADVLMHASAAGVYVPTQPRVDDEAGR